MSSGHGGQSSLSFLQRPLELVLPLGVIAGVLVILAPMPPALMDVLLACNITLAVIMLLTAIYVRRPLEFSLFPSLLLATTLARLVLNVATTRLILTRADADGMLAAGGVIHSFGEFVAGDKVIVGLVIFFILVVVQFVVITNGAGRISEVAARFVLDAMPGKQSAVDAEVNAGVIDQKQAQQRRREIARQADFYGAMDGASKFVRGDAVAGVIIIFINIIGGLAIGVFDGGMSVAAAASLYSKLTIGDGLVSQVPALLISLAAGLLITRSSDDTNLPREFLSQLFSRPQALAVAAGFLGVLVFTNLPAFPLLLLGGGCTGLAVLLTRNEQEQQRREQQEKAAVARRRAEDESRIEDHLQVDPMEIEIGAHLIRLADRQRGGDLMQRIKNVREQVARRLGIVMPKVRVRDNLRLDKDVYHINLTGDRIAEGKLMPRRLLALSTPKTPVEGGALEGEPAVGPAFAAPAVWIEPEQRRQAESLYYTIVEPAAVLATHLEQVVLAHADELLTRDALSQRIEELRKTSPSVVEELIPRQMPLADVQRVLQLLLREGVPIRQLALILEALGDVRTRGVTGPRQLAEQVRARLSRTISGLYRDEDKHLQAMTLDGAWEQRLREALVGTGDDPQINLPLDEVKSLCDALSTAAARLRTKQRPAVLVAAGELRSVLKRLTTSRVPNLPVVGRNEISSDTVVESAATIARRS